MDINNNIVTQRMSLVYKTRREIQKLACHILGPTVMTKIYYWLINQRKLDLDNPITFSDKICWLKIAYCPENQLVIDCSDKYLVRKYLEQKKLSEYLPELIEKWDNPKDIVWEKLPKKFALKCSHGCGYNIICTNKDELDEKVAKRLLARWLKDDFGYYNAEYHYNKSKRSIICEKYVESKNRLPVDYKIHCMNGIPKVLLVCADREKGEPTLYFYDLKKNEVDYGYEKGYGPLNLDDNLLVEMIKICNIIAPDFPFVRVDFYIDANRVILGELTFTPAAGFLGYLSHEGDLKMGEMLDITRELREKG